MTTQKKINPGMSRRGTPVVSDFSKSESMTEQSHLPQTQIKTILGKFDRLGIQAFNTNVMSNPENFRDVTDISFHEAMNVVTRAHSIFQEVPAKIRLDFDNDPEKFVDFLDNPANIEALEEYGFETTHLTGRSVDVPEADKNQMHLEELIEQKIAQNQNMSLQDASEEQLQQQLQQIQQQKSSSQTPQ